MPRKTVFITSFFGLVARNILSTDVLDILKGQSDVRVVIFAPEEKAALYRKVFAGGNVVVEGVSRWPVGRWESFAVSVFLNASDAAARRIHRLIERKRDKGYVRFIFHWFVAKLSRLELCRRWLRYCDYSFSPKNRFRAYFERYRPALVFATDIFEMEDIALVREAQSRGVYVLGMVRSWDNITTKGLNRVTTDKLVVNTPRIKDEAVEYCDFKPEDVVVVGIPHYDAYTAECRTPKSSLFKQLGLNPAKKTVLFAAPSDIYAQGDPITERIVALLMSVGVQVILRLYIVGEVNLGRLKPIAGQLAIDDPGGGGDFVAADLTGKDAHLADLIYHSDMVVAFASTMAIDAVVFDKPVVLVGFDGEDGRPYWKSLRRFYDYDHQRSIIKTGGVRLAHTPEELLTYLSLYLSNTHLDSDGRQRIIKERCWRLDGQSGRRLAAVVLELLSAAN